MNQNQGTPTDNGNTGFILIPKDVVQMFATLGAFSNKTAIGSDSFSHSRHAAKVPSLSWSITSCFTTTAARKDSSFPSINYSVVSFGLGLVMLKAPTIPLRRLEKLRSSIVGRSSSIPSTQFRGFTMQPGAKTMGLTPLKGGFPSIYGKDGYGPLQLQNFKYLGQLVPKCQQEVTKNGDDLPSPLGSLRNV